MPRPKPRLAVARLDDRVVPTVYSWGAGAAGAPAPPDGHTGYWLPRDPNAWDNAYNWANQASGKTNDGVPGANDTVVFDGSLTFTYVDANGPHTVQTSGSSLNDANHPTEAHAVNVIQVGPDYGAQTITSAGLTVTSGGLIQSGTLIGTFVNNGDLTIQTAGTVEVAGTLTNNAAVHLTNGKLVLGDSSSPVTGVLVNPLGSTVELSGTASLLTGFFASPRVVNSGTIRKVGGGTATVQNVLSDPASSIDVEAGTLDVQSFSTPTVIASTPLTVAAGATLQLDPQLNPVEWTGSIRVVGAGTVVVGSPNSGAFTWNAAVTAPDATLIVSGAVVQGTGALAAGSTLAVPKGTFYGTFTNNGTVRLTGTGTDASSPDDSISDGRFVNAGRLVVATPVLRVSHDQYAGVTLDNLPGATVEVTRDTQVVGGSSTGTAINNYGTLVVDIGVKSVAVTSVFNSLGGTVDVRSGAVKVTNDSTSKSTSGTFLVAAGATLDLRGANGFYGDGEAGDGGSYFGKYTGIGGGSVLFGGGTQFQATEFDFPDGMLAVAPNPGQTSNFVFGGFVNDNVLAITNPARGRRWTVGVGAGASYVNRGVIRVAPNVALRLTLAVQSPSSDLTNLPGAAIEFGDGASVTGSGDQNVYADDGYPLVTNRGTFHFLGSGSVHPRFDNLAGTIEADGPVTLDYPRLSSQAVPGLTGTWVARHGGSIALPNSPDLGGVATFRGTANVDGTGSDLPFLHSVTTNQGSLTVQNGATLAFATDLTNAGQVTVAGGILAVGGTLTLATGSTLAVTVGGPPTVGSYGRVTAGGSVVLGGTLVAGLTNGYVPADADRYPAVAAPAVTGTFAQQRLNGFVAQVTPANVTLAPASAAADLAVTDVQLVPPSSGAVLPGSTVTARFTVTNRSGRAAAPGWSDAVYLSGSDALDASAALVGRLTESAGLAAYAFEALTLSFTVPALPGVFSLLVVADSRVSVPDLDRSNNTAATLLPVTVSAPDLPLATDVAAAFPAGGVIYYKLTVPAGAGVLRVTAAFDAADAGTLAVRFAAPPVGAADDTVRTATPAGAGRLAAIDLPAAQAGVYYVAVARRTASPVTLRADSATLAVTGLGGEADLSGQVQAGGTLTLTVRGGSFTPATTFALGGLTWDGTQSPATSVTLFDAGTAVVTFPVPAVGPLYLGASNGGSPVVYLGKAFTPVAVSAHAAFADWNVQVSLPAALRDLREFSVTVTFRNDSGSSQPAPLSNSPPTTA